MTVGVNSSWGDQFACCVNHLPAVTQRLGQGNDSTVCYSYVAVKLVSCSCYQTIANDQIEVQDTDFLA